MTGLGAQAQAIQQAQWMLSNSSTTSAAITNCTFNTSGTITSQTGYSNFQQVVIPSFKDLLRTQSSIDILEDWKGKIKLPDGAIIKIDDKGNYKINDKNAKVVYRANRIREFNRYLNASDLLEEFIKDLKPYGVRQQEVVDGLFGVFIHWLILKAAAKDGDPIPEGIKPIQKHPVLAAPRKTNHCRTCGKFITHKAIENQLPFCSENHVLVSMRRGLQKCI